MRARWIPVLVVILGCESGPERSAAELFRGRWMPGVYNNSFLSCGSFETWVTAVPDSALHFAIEQRLRKLDRGFSTLSDANGPYYAEFRGDTTPLGPYGHLGMADRGLHVRELVALRVASAVDCAEGADIEASSAGAARARTELVRDSASAVRAALRHLDAWEANHPRPMRPDIVAQQGAVFRVWLVPTDSAGEGAVYVVQIDSAGVTTTVWRSRWPRRLQSPRP